MEIKNWKLVELSDKILSVSQYSYALLEEITQKQDLPLTTQLTGIDRAETEFDWKKSNKNFVFYIDSCLDGKELANLLSLALFDIDESVYVIFSQDDIVVEMGIEVFCENAEDLFYATFFNTVVFGKNQTFLLEVSRDYHLHSNIQIARSPKVFPLLASD